MAHIAIIITGLTGRLHSSFELATKLQNEGHSVIYLSPIDVRQKVEALGFSYVQLSPINFDYKASFLDSIQSSPWLERCSYHFKNYFNHYEIGKKVLGLDEYRAKLEEVNADHFIIDEELHDLIFTAYSLNTPITLFTAWFSNKMGLGTKLPPLRTDIIPGKGIKGGAPGILANWLFIKLKVQARRAVNKLTFKDYRRAVLKKYAKTQGFPTNDLISSNLPALFRYSNLPIASLTIKEMDFPHIPAKNFIYIGPMVHEKRDSKIDIEIDNAINNIIQKKQKTGKKLIYFSNGSILKPDIDFINKIMKAVADNKDWLLLISLGGKSSADVFKAQPNCFFLDWAPQLKVLKHSDCCITHAGINTINECLHFDVPMLVYSCKKADENGNAARVHYHKLGIMRDKHKDTVQDIKENLEKILNDTSFQENIRTINKIHQTYKQKNLSSLLNIEA